MISINLSWNPVPLDMTHIYIWAVYVLTWYLLVELKGMSATFLCSSRTLPVSVPASFHVNSTAFSRALSEASPLQSLGNYER